MSVHALSYAVVTPAKNEVANLAALAESILAQSALPETWVIVDDGSTDGTRELADELAREHSWISLLSLPATGRQARGGPVVRAFKAGVQLLDRLPDVVVKLDADVTFDPHYFEKLLGAFASEPELGIASGVCYELRSGTWVPSYGTRSHVWGAARAYRRECIGAAFPLEERQGWDEIDALRVRLEGWETRVIPELPFHHHRAMGSREGRRRVWLAQGETAYYMGYRLSYLLARTAYRLRKEPQAAMMLWGFAASAVRRQPRLPDRRVRAYLRSHQRIRSLPLRARETRGHV